MEIRLLLHIFPYDEKGRLPHTRQAASENLLCLFRNSRAGGIFCLIWARQRTAQVGIVAAQGTLLIFAFKSKMYMEHLFFLSGIVVCNT